jgi:hypothetical protein
MEIALPTKNIRRYPGAKPFLTSEKDIFFGRTQDISKLYRLLRLEQLVVLYGKSGLGKSSIINAGIIPKIEKDNDFTPLSIRFGAYTEGKQEMPSSIVRNCVEQSVSPILEKLLQDDQSLWRSLKSRQLNGEPGFLLIFDQFEELFTYPPHEIERFGQQLGELFFTTIPSRYRNALDDLLDETPNAISENDIKLLYRAFPLRVLVAIRSDRMSLLNRLSSYLPNMLKNCYELLALNRNAAEEAILAPAYQRATYFASPQFDYDDDALDHILDFLTHQNTQPIESFQLQILCQSIEEKIIDKQLKIIKKEDISDPQKVYENYYENHIGKIEDLDDQLAARRFIEEGLVFEEEERRLSLYEGVILKQYGINPKLLRTLVDSHLIRAEPSMQKGYTYELSHDTLVPPVLKAKTRRLHAERVLKAEQERQARAAELRAINERAEKETRLREAAEASAIRARRLLRTASFIAIVAIATSVSAGYFYMQARQKEAIALEEQQKAQQERQVAKEQESNALKNLRQFHAQKIKELCQNAETFLRSGDCLIAINTLNEAFQLDTTNTKLKTQISQIRTGCK